jgi:hypothetical protein
LCFAFLQQLKTSTHHVSELPVELDEDGDDAVPVLSHGNGQLGRNIFHEKLEKEKVTLGLKSKALFLLHRLEDLSLASIFSPV